MMDDVGVFREAAGLHRMLERLRDLRGRYQQAAIQDRGSRFNTDLEEALEMGSLLDLAWATTRAALARTESRGSHYREDFPRRDDAHCLTHSLAFLHDEAIDLEYKPVTVTRFQPQPRTY